MRVKIIKNTPPDNNITYSDISEYIGKVFKVVDIIKFDADGKPNNGVVVIIDGCETDIYEGEYEIV